jgi:hypothetical protein
VAAINNLAAVLTVLTGLIACLALAAATGPGSRLIIFLVLAGTRLRTVVGAARKAGLPAGKSGVPGQVRAIARAQYTGTPYNLAVELEWLARLYGVDQPVTMADGQITREDLELLSTGYQRLAGHGRARLLFGAKGNEVIAQQVRVAEQTAAFLRQHSLHMVQDPSPAEIIDLRPRGLYLRLMSRQPSAADALHQASRTGKPRFDGILPFVLQHRLELDGGSGRTLLHLGIAEIPYSSLLARNVAWDPERQEPPAAVPQHAVTLAVVPVTSDGYLLLSRRAEAAGSYAGKIGPYITGNAELRDRRGVAADRDESGIPDLLAAAAREGMEEAGLALDPHRVRILGLAQIWSGEDTGIFVLLLSAGLTQTAAEVAQLTRYSDPVEGSWEVGHELYAVSLWEDGQSTREVLEWIAADPEVIPHAIACVTALAYKTSGTRIPDWRDILGSAPPRPGRIIKTLPVHRPYR